MKIYVINMDRRPDRWLSFNENNRDKIPFEFERFSAIEDKPGDLGCGKSHLEIMRNQTEFPFAILEDDCIMIEDWSLVEEAISQLPNCWDALWLGANLSKPIRRWSKNAFILQKAYCTHAIIYNNRKILDFVLNNYIPVVVPQKRTWIIDVFYYTYVFDRFNCFITYPLCATQTDDYSDIAQKPSESWIIKENYERYTVPTRKTEIIKPPLQRRPKPRGNEIHRRRIR